MKSPSQIAAEAYSRAVDEAKENERCLQVLWDKVHEEERRAATFAQNLSSSLAHNIALEEQIGRLIAQLERSKRNGAQADLASQGIPQVRFSADYRNGWKDACFKSAGMVADATLNGSGNQMAQILAAMAEEPRIL